MTTLAQVEMETDTHFAIPEDERPSGIRRLLRRTLYLRILEGEFILWCFETNRITRHQSDFLRHARVLISDPAGFVPILKKSLTEVGAGWALRPAPILIVHALRQFPDGISPIEKDAIRVISNQLGIMDLNLLIPEQTIDINNAKIVTLCLEMGAFNRKLVKIKKIHG